MFPFHTLKKYVNLTARALKVTGALNLNLRFVRSKILREYKKPSSLFYKSCPRQSIPSFSPKDNGQDRAIPAAQAMKGQLLQLFLDIPGLFLKSSALVIQIAANTRARHRLPENTGRREIFQS